MEVRRLAPDLDAPFLRFMADEAAGRGSCFCAAWWVPTWEEWESRTPAENRALREALLARGERDGFLLLDGDEVVGWCQAGPRDRLPKLAAQFGLAPDPGAWAVTCFEVAPSHRGRGAARLLLKAAVAEARARGATSVEGFPRCGAALPPGEAWTGPEGLFRGAGFVEAATGRRGPVMRLDLRGGRTPQPR